MAEVIKYGVPRGLGRSIAGEGLQAFALCCVHDDDPGSRGVDRHAARRELLVGSGQPAWRYSPVCRKVTITAGWSLVSSGCRASR